jgi:hypothetical protein
MTIYYECSNYLVHHGIKGQKWGIRRYQNKDGTLTDKGKARYERDVRENKAKKKDSRIDVSNPDPQRWVREDLERQKTVIDNTSKLVDTTKAMERASSPKATKKRMDLSRMTNKELKEAIEREQLEQRYNQLFNSESEPAVSKGREFARNMLETTGDVLAIGSSALAIALAIRQLKG